MTLEFSSKPKKDDGNLTLTRSPESHDSTSAPRQDNLPRPTIRRDSLQLFSLRNRVGADYKNMIDLHPYVQTLTVADLESCVALENSAFPPEERCSPEKFLYRLSVCPELCLGLYSTSNPDDPQASAPTYPFARAPNSATPARKGVLLGHVIATKCDSDTVTDASADYLPEWQSGVPLSELRGHQEHGRTIAVHSLAVLPAFRKRGLGKTILKAYTQRIESSGIANRVSLVAHDDMIKFYEALGFVNKGDSQCKFGGGRWFDMVYDFGPRILDKTNTTPS